MEYLNQWLAMERNFDGMPWVRFAQSHGDIPIFAIALYLVVVFWLPSRLSKPLPLRGAFALWNALLSIFSTIGFTRTVPTLVNTLLNKGYFYSVCHNPMDWYGHGPSGIWVGLFIYSKFPELFDTVFLVLQKKQVGFLQWFHHTTVLLYCWHAFHCQIAPGLWFASMNYTVHMIMYAYFAFMSMSNATLRSVAKKISPFITTLQLLQMVMGMVVTTTSAYWHHSGETCAVDPANYRLGLIMYFSYFVLFALLFRDSYCTGKRKPPTTGCIQDAKQTFPYAAQQEGSGSGSGSGSHKKHH
eukprot:TRINITY_DN536_c0_g1_i1.p1 TRINITY_DN536_c0_g1~~TRINITY_DN536_c0_g1_i1.p1  ORF type:complete len:299 (+),score=71.70 TRINITY_DN536_c0_g1_i1:134-1030(+)